MTESNRLSGNEFAAHVGKLVRQARDERNLTQAQLAEAVSRRRPSISDIENGKTIPDVMTLVLMAEVLEKPLMFFIPPAWQNLFNDDTLTLNETELLNLYRRIQQPDFQQVAIKLVQCLVDHEAKQGIVEPDR